MELASKVSDDELYARWLKQAPNKCCSLIYTVSNSTLSGVICHRNEFNSQCSRDLVEHQKRVVRLHLNNWCQLWFRDSPVSMVFSLYFVLWDKKLFSTKNIELAIPTFCFFFSLGRQAIRKALCWVTITWVCSVIIQLFWKRQFLPYPTRVRRLPQYELSPIFLNTVHSGCKPSSSMSSFTHSHIFLPVFTPPPQPPHISNSPTPDHPPLSCSRCAKLSQSVAHASPPQPHTEQIKQKNVQILTSVSTLQRRPTHPPHTFCHIVLNLRVPCWRSNLVVFLFCSWCGRPWLVGVREGWSTRMMSSLVICRWVTSRHRSSTYSFHSRSLVPSILHNQMLWRWYYLFRFFILLISCLYHICILCVSCLYCFCILFLPCLYLVCIIFVPYSEE